MAPKNWPQFSGAKLRAWSEIESNHPSTIATNLETCRERSRTPRWNPG